MPIRAFFQPTTPQEAVQLMHEGPGRGAYLAGGTDLLCAPELPDFVVNVRDLLKTSRREGEVFVLGAATPVSRLEDWEELAAADAGLLRACARAFASRQLRNMATVGGNLASAVPSADLAPPLLVLEAEGVIQGLQGQRRLPLERFFHGPHRSALEPAELLVEVRFPAPAPGTRTAFAKLARTPGDIAQVNVAVLLELEGERVKTARIALGAVAPTPIRAREAEGFLSGQPATEEALDRAAALAQAATRPIDDQRASAAYRRHVSGVLVRRALEQCLRRNA